MELLANSETVRLLLEIGAFGVLLLLYVHDRLIGEPRRVSIAEKRMDKIIEGFRQERQHDRDQMERMVDKLSASIDKLSNELDEMRRARAA